MEQPFPLGMVDRRALARAFSQLFVGFVFVFDFGLQGFDVLPDLVAYALFLKAAQNLKPLHPRGAVLANLAVALLPLGAVAFMATFGLGLLGKMADLAAGLLVVVFVWNLGALVIAVADALGRADLARAADNRRMLFVLLFGGLTAGGIFVYLSTGRQEFTSTGPEAAVVALLLIVVGLAAMFLLMDLMKKTERACLGAA